MNIDDIWSHKSVLILLVFSLLFVLVGVVLVYLNIDNLSFPLILHFNDYEGVDLVGGAQDLWNLLIMEGVVVFINIILGTLLFYRERALSYVVLSVNLLIAFLSLIAVVNIITLN